MKIDKFEIAKAVDAYTTGELPRRAFLGRLSALGLSTGLAGTLATMYSNEAFALSSKETDSVGTGFDYIIVGSGSAGAALAYRLATASDARILVLEAGGNDDVPEIHDSRKWVQTLGTRAAKWFETTRQVHAGNRVHIWPRGNVLGGTSCLNAMIYARGHHSDFDSWAYAGCVGWDYKSVLKHFKAYEDYEGGANDYRAVGGPLHVTVPQPGLRHEGGQMYIDASQALGFKQTMDINGPTMEGPAWADLTIKDQHRQSTAVAFLKPAMATRKNLTVLTDAPVTRLVLEGGRCVGVEYLHAGKPRIVRADREVVLSAGAFDTPRLLMLSGIGRAADLKAAGVKPVVDLRGVGQNLQDHLLSAGINYESPTPLPPSVYNASEVYMWAKSDSRLPGPDYTTLYLSAPISTPLLPMKGIQNGWSICGGLNRPTSTGTVKLRSNKVGDKLLIDPNYLATDHDRRVLAQATQVARETAQQAAFAAVRTKEWLPGPDVRVGTKEWAEFVANASTTFHHPTSTCKMGVDADAVVDPELRVYNVKGLRIADASIFPAVPTSNTNAPSIMTGWKCAEMILGNDKATRRV